MRSFVLVADQLSSSTTSPSLTRDPRRESSQSPDRAVITSLVGPTEQEVDVDEPDDWLAAADARFHLAGGNSTSSTGTTVSQICDCTS